MRIDACGDRHLKRCGVFASGHHPHLIHTNRALGDLEHPPLRGRLVDAHDDGFFVLDLDGERWRLWNHDPNGLKRRLGSPVRLYLRWGLLKVGDASLGVFCVAWTDVDQRLWAFLAGSDPA